MNKLFILSAMALLLPVVPALACFDDGTLFRTSSEGAHGGRSFTREPIPMSFCESGERSFVVVMGKCYDQDAITDFDTEEECQADPVCEAYREQQRQDRQECDPQYNLACQDDTSLPPPELRAPEPAPSPPEECSHEGLGPDVCRPIDQGDPNHGEIKGDEELEQDEEEHQEEEEQGQEEKSKGEETS